MMKSPSSSTQLSNIKMANHHYHYQHFHYSWSLLTIIGLLIIQESTFALAPNSHSDLVNVSNSPSTATTTVLNHSNDEDMDDGMRGSQEQIYDDEDEENNIDDGISATNSQSNHNQSIHLDDESQHYAYDDETNEHREDEIDEDPNMSINRFESKRPMGDLNNKKSSEPQSTARMPFITSNLWRDIFSKPPILVGIIGAIVVGILSAILLIMFIIYRMRKKDEGSYALEEGPRKSPSHAYTRVSSREFFA